MATGITVDLDDSLGKAKIRALEQALANPRPLYATLGRLLVNRIRVLFRLGIDPWGTPWLPLKIRKGQPLRDTGRLQRSISFTATDDGVSVGTNLRQAALQQFGGTIVPKPGNKRLVFKGPAGTVIFAKKVVVPARPFMPLRRFGAPPALPPEWSVAASGAIRAYLDNAASKAGG